MTRVLFILKYRENPYGGGETCYSENNGCYTNHPKHLSSGLFNSASFVCGMLKSCGCETHMVQVIDNNCIDREVTKFKPDYVIIEAYWVVPDKFDILQKLHPNVKWIIRNHSEMPFLSFEGMAIGWTIKYAKYPNVYISSNSPVATHEVRSMLKGAYPDWTKEELEEKTPYLPNFYPTKTTSVPHINFDKKEINIGCFGAVRPLKNQLIQAVAAIKFADSIGKNLVFHMNTGRIEGKADPIIKNIRQMFALLPNHKLVEHGWLDHHDFLHLLRKMDMSLQVSFSETFNIVSADAVNENIPIVVSDEVDWACSLFVANPNEAKNITKIMKRTWFITKYFRFLNRLNKCSLKRYSNRTRQIWCDYFGCC